MLPLSVTTLKSIAVIGPMADSRRDTIGPWTFNFALDETVSVAAGIRAKVGSGVTVGVAPGVPPPVRKFPSPFAMIPGFAQPRPQNFDEAGRQRLRLSALNATAIAAEPRLRRAGWEDVAAVTALQQAHSRSEKP